MQRRRRLKRNRSSSSASDDSSESHQSSDECSAAPIDGFPQGPCPGSDSSGEDDEDAADQLIGFCMQLLLERTLTFKMFCIIMYYAGQFDASAARKCKGLGMKPNRKSGHYGRTCREKLGIWTDSEFTYDLTFPGREKERWAGYQSRFQCLVCTK